jgi:sporulation protein YlmC with PRC-barrel domain
MSSLRTFAIVAGFGLTAAGCTQPPQELRTQEDSSNNGAVVGTSDLGTKWVSDVVGMRVETSTGARLGNVNDVLIDGEGRQTYAIISYAGMMGLGNKYTAVPWRNVGEMLQRDRLVMDQVQLESAPLLSSAKPDLSSAGWHRAADDYWGGRIPLRRP